VTLNDNIHSIRARTGLRLKRVKRMLYTLVFDKPVRCLMSLKSVMSFIATMSVTSNVNNRIGGVMISVLASSAVDRRFENRSGQTKDYETGMCYFSAKHPALRRKSKDWLARNQNNVSEWDDMSTRGLLFQ
jgi:hypothetical protein